MDSDIESVGDGSADIDSDNASLSDDVSVGEVVIELEDFGTTEFISDNDGEGEIIAIADSVDLSTTEVEGGVDIDSDIESVGDGSADIDSDNASLSDDVSVGEVVIELEDVGSELALKDPVSDDKVMLIVLVSEVATLDIVVVKLGVGIIEFVTDNEGGDETVNVVESDGKIEDDGVELKALLSDPINEEVMETKDVLDNDGVGDDKWIGDTGCGEKPPCCFKNEFGDNSSRLLLEK